MSERAPPIGTLTDRVQLQRRDVAQEGEGGHAVTYVPIASAWSRVKLLSSRQVAEAEARGVALSHAVVLRFRTDIGPGDRIVYRGRVLDIVAAGDLNGRRAYLSCRCVERVVTG